MTNNVGGSGKGSVHDSFNEDEDTSSLTQSGTSLIRTPSD